MDFIIFVVIFISLLVIYMNYTNTKKFKENPISKYSKQQIEDKRVELVSIIEKKFYLSLDIPIIVMDNKNLIFKNSRAWGITEYKNGNIKIYIKKNILKESEKYVLNTVLPHEFAHAIMFKNNHFYEGKEGHNSKWKEICETISNDTCSMYVDREKVVKQKIDAFFSF